MKKFDSLEGLREIRNDFKEAKIPEEEIVPEDKKEDTIEVFRQNKEKKLEPEIGTIIEPSFGDGGKIPSWRNEMGFYTEILPSNKKEKEWVISKGGEIINRIIVFLDKEPQKGDRIKIEHVYEKRARGIVI